ncbi:MAG TPA: ABC transporter ATP-binding protein [Clostridiales bacterium]|nr:ABC transporter ATP-binding protein [Clostridiales bacterium]
MSKSKQIGAGKPPKHIYKGVKPKNIKKTLIRLFGYLKEYKLQLIIVAICILLNSGTGIALNGFVKPLIDKYILPLVGVQNPDLSGFLTVILAMCGVALIGLLAGYIYNRLMINITQGTLKTVRDQMYKHMQKLPIKYFDNTTHGNLMSRYTNDAEALRQTLSQSIPSVISSSITVVGVFIVMLIYSWILTLLVVGMLVIMLLTVRFFGGRSSRFFISQQQAIGQLNGYAEEMLHGQKVVKVFSYEQQAKRKFDEVNQNLYENANRAHTYANMLMPIMVNLSYLSYALIAVLGGFLIARTPFLTVGALSSFLLLTRSFTMPINQMSNQINFIVMSIAGAERIFEVLDEPIEQDQGTVTLVKAKKDQNGQFQETTDADPQGVWCWKKPSGDGAEFIKLKGDVRFKDVNFSYDGKKLVLKNVNLYAKPGQKIAFVGATGAGKTTITNLINRFYDIQQGQITYDGIDIKDIKKSSLRRSLGIVLQDTHLFTGTVRDNIRYGKLDATDEEIEKAAKLANADFFIKHLPEGFDTVLTGDGANLSQGQRQLLSIARAAVADPPVLILDEATSSVDTRTEKIIQEGMDKLMEGRTVFVIAHRLSTIRNAQAIIVLEQGEIIERGDHEELIDYGGKYYQLYTGALELS